MMASTRHLSTALVASVLVALAACGGEGGEDRPGGGALGGDAKVVTLARAPLGSPPPARAGWTAWRVTLEPGKQLEHEHALATVYAEAGAHLLTVDGRPTRIKQEDGEIVQRGRRHVHAATDEPSVFWDVVLAAPGAARPATTARRVFDTGPLDGIPPRAEVAFLDVAVPPGGQTTVHTHPGPETIYVTDGPFDYQNGIEGITRLDDGDLKSIPPNTAVQKRNPGTGRARFLSWFIVDPSKDFAPSAEFAPGD